MIAVLKMIFLSEGKSNNTEEERKE